jgi:diguanylate cyclase (GGDEF)-like protein/PAS domain S-box-containing protein
MNLKGQILQDHVRVPLVILSRQDEHLTTINTVLRNAGHPVHCIRIEQLNELEKTLIDRKPELILLFEEERLFELPSLTALLEKFKPSPPLVLVRNDITEQVIADAMECGARDVVSLTHRNRLQAVLGRELASYNLEVALDGVVSSASQYKQELRTLMDGSGEAMADIQEGIMVSANPAWLNLFGYKNEDDMVGVLFMDMYRESDQSGLKGALIACLKDKWDDALLEVVAHQADGKEFPLAINLEKVSIDGDPAVRVVAPMSRAQSPREMLEQAVYKDPSTNFYHRRYFLEKLEERLNNPLSAGVRAVAYIRPDRFAEIHDDIGLLATETLLTCFADLLKELMQPNDIYGRFGGTMFAVLLERGNMIDVEAWAEQIRKTVERKIFDVEQQSTSLTCVVGLCEIEAGSESVAEILTEAEKACRQGREVGGNRVEMTERDRASQATRNTDAVWVPRIRDALMKNRLRLIHQPVASLQEELEGIFDTSIRMLDEDDNVLLPGEFMPAAERANMLKSIDRWVIGASFSFCAEKKPALVFVRLTQDSILDDTLVDWLETRLRCAGVNASQVCFQVSEEVASQQLGRTKALADQLSGIGFLFAVDHMGIGRDSAQVLKHVPMNFMKIDGSLMQGLHRDPAIQKKVEDLAKLATQQNIRTIAERIEDAKTIAVLWQIGIALIQGNYVQMRNVVLEDTQTIRGLSCN